MSCIDDVVAILNNSGIGLSENQEIACQVSVYCVVHLLQGMVLQGAAFAANNAKGCYAVTAQSKSNILPSVETKTERISGTGRERESGQN